MKAHELQQLIGATRHNLTALGLSDVRKDGGRQMLRCRCKCGTETLVRPYRFAKGDAWSCGCHASERAAARNYRHGSRDTPEYRVWTGMIGRCHNPKNKSFPRYGGRGIAVCDRWRDSFQDFLRDVGPRPSPSHSIDRIDNSRGYEPGNCRWATARTQTNNRGVTLLVTLDGETRPLAEWCEARGLNYYTVWSRISQRGWSPEAALSTPVTG